MDAAENLTKIKFETTFPSFMEIENQFHRQTGLHLRLKVNLNLNPLKSDLGEVITLLQADVASVLGVYHEWSQFQQTYFQQYEKLMEERVNVIQQLKQFNHMSNPYFHILGFYELEFEINDKVLEIKSDASQFYGIASLTKVFIDLGGNFLESNEPTNANKPDNWTKLKKWREYKWFNKPRK